MSTRTPEQTLQKFDHRPGTEEVPTLGGMSRLGDEASIPIRQHHLLVNVRFGPGEMTERPGLSEELDTESGTCVTGLIETVENTGQGGPLRGLVIQYGDNGIEQDGLSRHFHIGPRRSEDNPLSPESVGVNLIPYDTTTAFLYYRIWPLNRTRAIYNGPNQFGGGTGLVSSFFGVTQGPFFPFKFQGNTCSLGLLGSGAGATVALFAITGADNGSAGAINTIALLGPSSGLSPQSVAVREEIIGGEVKEVLYIGASTKVMRFDGTTLTQWFTNPSVNPGSLHVFAEGQEILILHNSSTLEDEDADIFYQPYPGATITASVLPGNLFEDPANAGRGKGGWTGACKFRESWVVLFEGGQQVTTSNVVCAFSGAITATAGGATLTFAQVYQNGPFDNSAIVYHIGSPIVWQDQIVFFASQTMAVGSNGNSFFAVLNPGGAASDGRNRIGNYTDANGWQVPAVDGPTLPAPGYWEWADGQIYDFQNAFHLSVGNTYIFGFSSQFSGELVYGLTDPYGFVRIRNDAVPDSGPQTRGLFPQTMAEAAFFSESEEEGEV